MERPEHCPDPLYTLMWYVAILVSFTITDGYLNSLIMMKSLCFFIRFFFSVVVGSIARRHVQHSCKSFQCYWMKHHRSSVKCHSITHRLVKSYCNCHNVSILQIRKIQADDGLFTCLLLLSLSFVQINWRQLMFERRCVRKRRILVLVLMRRRIPKIQTLFSWKSVTSVDHSNLQVQVLVLVFHRTRL